VFSSFKSKSAQGNVFFTLHGKPRGVLESMFFTFPPETTRAPGPGKFFLAGRWEKAGV
jgi:hypothetical protein